MLTGRDRDLHATALAVTQLHIGKQKEMEQLQLQHTRARILADGYVTAGGVHSWTTVTPCPQCDVNVTTTRLMQHGEHQNRQACHVCVCAPPPDHNADTVVPGLGQVRWDDRTKTMYTDVDGGSNLMYWNKQDPTWHRADRASQPHQWYTGLPARVPILYYQMHRVTGSPSSLASKLGWPAPLGPMSTPSSPTSPPSRGPTRSPQSSALAPAHPERNDARADRIARLTNGIVRRPEPDADPANAKDPDQRRGRQPRNATRCTARR